MKTRHSKQVLVGLSVFSDGVLHFLQIKKKCYLLTENILWLKKRLSEALFEISDACSKYVSAVALNAALLHVL